MCGSFWPFGVGGPPCQDPIIDKDSIPGRTPRALPSPPSACADGCRGVRARLASKGVLASCAPEHTEVSADYQFLGILSKCRRERARAAKGARPRPMPKVDAHRPCTCETIPAMQAWREPRIIIRVSRGLTCHALVSVGELCRANLQSHAHATRGPGKARCSTHAARF